MIHAGQNTVGAVQNQCCIKRSCPCDRKLDVGTGTFFSNLVMYFIILTAALTLHAHGLKQITTSREAAEALEPLAGVFAAALYTVGLIGVGFLAIPTLTGSAAYALAEIFKWRHGLDESLSSARYFYRIVIGSTFAGILIDFANINPVRALFWTAVINGVLAPFLLVAILVAASDRKLMQAQPSSWLSRFVVGITALPCLGQPRQCLSYDRCANCDVALFSFQFMD
jgi:Mn2+/Fe2+ NRAMP family transporter